MKGWFFLLGVCLLAVSVATAGPVYINGVPDWDQPVLVAGGPGGGPNGPWGAWCVPTATANVVGYYNDGGVAGIGDNQVFTATPAWPANTWQDETADGVGARTDLGWYYNTNDVGIAASGWSAYRGTMLADILKGLVGGAPPWTGYFPAHGLPQVVVRNYGAPVPNMNAFVYGRFDTTGDVQGTHNAAGGFAEIKREIDNNRPLLGHFNHFSLVNRQQWRVANGAGWDYDTATWGEQPDPGFVDPVTGEAWNPTEGLGHTVTVVGYYLANDPCNPFFNGVTDAVIVHDNGDGFLGNAPLPLVLPWQPSPWSGLTSIQNVPEPMAALLLVGAAAWWRRRS